MEQKHYKSSGAIRTISNELYSLVLIETDMYHINDQNTIPIFDDTPKSKPKKSDVITIQQLPRSIDVEANVVSLCVICNKKLHHAILNEKSAIFEKLYAERHSHLKKSGITITFDHLVNLYR